MGNKLTFLRLVLTAADEVEVERKIDVAMLVTLRHSRATARFGQIAQIVPSLFFSVILSSLSLDVILFAALNMPPREPAWFCHEVRLYRQCLCIVWLMSN